MSNINLATKEQGEEKNNFLSMGLIVFSLILLLLIGIYITLIFFNRNLSSKIDATQNEYESEFGNFLSGGGNEIFDFKNRGDVAKKMLAEDKSVAMILTQIEASILPQVHLESFKYDKSKKTASLICIGDNFETVASQVLSFKQNNYFSVVTPSQSKLDSENFNKVIFNVDLIIK